MEALERTAPLASTFFDLLGILGVVLLVRGLHLLRVFSAPTALQFDIASADTSAASTGGLGLDGVLGRQQMTAREMPLPGQPSTDVLPVRDGFQMGRIHTSGFLAKVIQLQTFGNRPDQHLVHRAVGCNRAVTTASRQLQDPVPVVLARPVPNPASRVTGWDFAVPVGGEVIPVGQWRDLTGDPSPLVMRFAVTTALRRTIARIFEAGHIQIIPLEGANA